MTAAENERQVNTAKPAPATIRQTAECVNCHRMIEYLPDLGKAWYHVYGTGRLFCEAPKW